MCFSSTQIPIFLRCTSLLAWNCPRSLLDRSTRPGHCSHFYAPFMKRSRLPFLFRFSPVICHQHNWLSLTKLPTSFLSLLLISQSFFYSLSIYPSCVSVSCPLIFCTLSLSIPLRHLCVCVCVLSGGSRLSRAPSPTHADHPPAPSDGLCRAGSGDQ